MKGLKIEDDMRPSLQFILSALVFALLLHVSTVSIPPVFTVAEKEIELTIKATGNKAPEGKGSEVWLYSIQRSGGIDVPWNEIKLNEGWEFRQTLAVSYFSQPGIATWKGKISAPLYIYLGSHPYSGEVEITTNDGRTWKEQLYSKYQKKHFKIQIAPAYTFFEKFTSSLIFSLLAASVLTLFSRAKGGKLNYERGIYIFGFTSAIMASAIYSVSVARYFNGYPFNGALQFWNPLRRLAQGDLPGRDFFSFHGVGQALSFFPLYEILGGDFLASEFLRQFGTYLLFIISGAYFLRTLGLTQILALALTLISVFFEQLYPLAIPHESSLGLRTSLPLLIASIAYNVNKRNKNYIYLTAPLIGSLCMLWSTEQGPVALLSISVWIIAENKDKFLIGIGKAILSILFSLVLYICLLSLFTMGHPVEIIKYGLIDIGTDQRWFFGAPPNPFISRFNDFLSAPVAQSLVYLLIGTLTTIAFLLIPRLKSQDGKGLILFAIISSTTASFLMQTGYTSDLYNACAERAIYLTSSVFLYRLLPNPLKKFTAYPAYIVILLAPIYLSEQIFNLKERALSFRSYVYYPQLRASLGTYYEGLDKVVELVRDTNSDSFHSDYRGFVEEIIETNPDTRFDYIIHALGSNKRAEYLTLFENPPNFIQILKKSHTQYSRWLKQEIWPYYESILKGYEPITETNSSVIWKRRSEKLIQAEANTRVINHPIKEIDVGHLIAQSSQGTGNLSYWKIDVSYETGAKYFGQGLTRYLINYNPDPDAEAMPISLPPYKTEFSFPIIVKNSQLKLSFNSIGLFSNNSDLEIKELRLTPLQYPQISLEAMFGTNENHQ